MTRLPWARSGTYKKKIKKFKYKQFNVIYTFDGKFNAE